MKQGRSVGTEGAGETKIEENREWEANRKTEIIEEEQEDHKRWMCICT